MGLFDVLAALVVGGGVGGFMVLVGAGYLRNYARTRRSDPVEIRRLADPDGPVEFEGTAEVHEETATAPLTDTECLVHDWKIEEFTGGDGSNWSRLASGEATHPFLLADGTGSVLVDPDGATRHLEDSDTYTVEADESPPRSVAAFLDRTAAVDSEHSRTRRYREARLDPGDDVYVYGPVRETGHSVDLPGPASAVVGVDDPDERTLEVTADTSLSEVVEHLGADGEPDRYLLANTGEAGAQRTFLKTGLLWFGVGLAFLAIPVVVLLFG